MQISLKPDFVSVMDPDSSVTRSTNLTYAGIHSIWTGQDLALTPPSPTSIRSNSTLVSEIGRPPSQASTQREPVKQGSAAWTSLRNNQLPTRAQSTPIATPSPAPPTPERFVTKTLPDADFAAAVEHINARRDTEEHPGRIGRTRLPPTDKVAQRRMILAVCGERDAGEANKFVQYSATHLTAGRSRMTCERKRRAGRTSPARRRTPSGSS